VFIPFFAFLALAGLAVFLMIHPIKAPLDTTLAVNIAAVIFFGMIIPGVLLVMWVRSLPWWFLNGTERGWHTFQQIAEANGHRFPDDFWHPFIHNEFGLETEAFAEELVIDSKMDIEGFIGADINISYKDKAFVANKPIDHFGFYLDSAYWRLEQYGLRFYGERMNIFVPYWTIQKVRKGLLWCNIILKLDTTNHFDTQIFGHWTEICISIGHLPTMREDRLLRDELYRRIVSLNKLNKVARTVWQRGQDGLTSVEWLEHMGHMVQLKQYVGDMNEIAQAPPQLGRGED
jgi:hypothetical protein